MSTDFAPARSTCFSNCPILKQIHKGANPVSYSIFQCIFLQLCHSTTFKQPFVVPLCMCVRQLKDVEGNLSVPSVLGMFIWSQHIFCHIFWCYFGALCWCQLLVQKGIFQVICLIMPYSCLLDGHDSFKNRGRLPAANQPRSNVGHTTNRKG